MAAKLPSEIRPNCRMKMRQIAERNQAKLPNTDFFCIFAAEISEIYS
jgi:hypothetical protein